MTYQRRPLYPPHHCATIFTKRRKHSLLSMCRGGVRVRRFLVRRTVQLPLVLREAGGTDN